MRLPMHFLHLLSSLLFIFCQSCLRLPLLRSLPPNSCSILRFFLHFSSFFSGNRDPDVIFLKADTFCQRSLSTTGHSRRLWNYYLFLPWLLLSFSAVSTTQAEGGADEASLVPTTAPCWADVCKVEIVDGGDFIDPLLLDEPQTTTPVSAHATRVTCEGKVASVDDLCLHLLPSATRILEIVNTTISYLPASAFATLPHLRKLDLRNNKISLIEPFAFEGLSNLKRLDLSHNNVSSLNGTQLEGLSEVSRMKVGHNPLQRLEESVLEAMPSLRALEIGDTLLVCDCHLSWMFKASSKDGSGSPSSGDEATNKKHRRPLRLLGSATCQAPQRLRGLKLKKLNPMQLICDVEQPSVSVIEIEPGLDQVVFAGDSLRLNCRVSTRGNGPHSPKKVWWRRGETHLQHSIHEPIENHYDRSYTNEYQFEDVTIRTSTKDGRLESYVDIPELSWGHSGEWACMVEGKGFNNTKSVSVYVIHHDTKYCPVNVTNDNKGRYSWPRTVANVSVELPCEGMSPHHPPPFGNAWPSISMSGRLDIRFARHVCNQNGSWSSLDTMPCPFISETTKILEHFALTNLSATSSSLLESARTLRNFTMHGGTLRDPIDVFFLTETVRHYVDLVADSIAFHPTAQVLIDIIGSTLSSSKELLESAESFHRSCSRLLESLWNLADHVPSLTKVSTRHLDVYQISVHPDAFTGVSCVWFRKSRQSTDRQFRCNTHNYSLLYAIEDEVTDARIRLPPNLFSNFNLSNTSNYHNETNLSQPLPYVQFFVYDTAKLFPSDRSDSWKITSPVIGVRVKNGDVITTVDSVFVTLRSAIYSHNIAPSMWSPGNNETFGKWANEDCKIVRLLNSLVLFRCNKLSHYGLLQDMTSLYRDVGRKGAAFKLSPPAIYLGSTISCLFLMASIATWGIHHKHICTMSKNKHSFMNTWIALMFLIALFTVGIYQTETILMCQAIGVILHYLTICVLLWIIVSVTNLYKKVVKILRPPVPSDEPLPDTPLPQKPMLRFYLVGWGIALILCGISAAVNLQHYGTFSYCFLAWNPSMAAFYAPSAVLVLILATFFLLTQCVLKGSHAGYSEATGNTETTDLELLDTASPGSEVPPSAHADDELSLASQTSSISLTDSQHSPTTQLRAHAVTLILFLLTWASAAITTASPFAAIIPYHTTIFSILYAICSSSLGIFIFVFFCASRSDAMEAWKEFSFSYSSTVKEDEAQLTLANNVTPSCYQSPPSQTTPINNQIQPHTSASLRVAPSIRSIDSSNTHPTNKSSSLSQSIHNTHKAESIEKTSNALHMLNMSSLHENVQYAPEMFYNPKQAGVAKRFFQKQRLKQMMKQNNLEVNRVDSDCNSSTVYQPRASHRNIHSESDISSFDTSSYLGLSSKVNNTNIHVDTMYSNDKHPLKSLTPELLCVLGPTKEPCSIVSSIENDQYQWPMTVRHHCTQNPVFIHPKHMNVSLSPRSNEGRSNLELNTDLGQFPRLSPVHFTEVCNATPRYYEAKSPEARLKRITLSKNQNRQKRLKRKRSRSRGSGREEQEWSEDDRQVLVIGTSLKSTDTSSGIANSSPLQEDQPPRSQISAPSLTPLSFSPLSHTPSPLPPSLPSTGFNNISPLSPTPPHLLSHFSSSPCRDMDWLHLLNQRRQCVGEDSINQSQTYLPTVEPHPYFDDLCCSDSESADGGAECENWERELEGRVYERGASGISCGNSFDCESDGGVSSIGTSLVPGVDNSPPPSLPVSDSPFDSPRKFHQNTPDTLSLDSESLLSPLRSHFSSTDNPLNSPVTPTLTLTLSTPVNTPVSPSTPTTSLYENDMGTIGSSNTIVRAAFVDDHKNSTIESWSSGDGVALGNSSMETVFGKEVLSSSHIKESLCCTVPSPASNATSVSEVEASPDASSCITPRSETEQHYFPSVTEVPPNSSSSVTPRSETDEPYSPAAPPNSSLSVTPRSEEFSSLSTTAAPPNSSSSATPRSEEFSSLSTTAAPPNTSSSTTPRSEEFSSMSTAAAPPNTSLSITPRSETDEIVSPSSPMAPPNTSSSISPRSEAESVDLLPSQQLGQEEFYRNSDLSCDLEAVSSKETDV